LAAEGRPVEELDGPNAGAVLGYVEAPAGRPGLEVPGLADEPGSALGSYRLRCPPSGSLIVAEPGTEL
jgi:hypothetical protein